MQDTRNRALERDDHDGRLKDLERRVHTLEDSHEDLVRAAHGQIEATDTINGTPPPEETVSDRERMAEERAATGRAHSDTRDARTQAADRAKGGDHSDPSETSKARSRA